MTPERLAAIEDRVRRNQSHPDIPELALELIAALKERMVSPPPAPHHGSKVDSAPVKRPAHEKATHKEK